MHEETAARWNGYIAEILVEWAERHELLADGDAIIDAIVTADIGGHD
jgi:hypothetical protein